MHPCQHPFSGRLLKDPSHTPKGDRVICGGNAHLEPPFNSLASRNAFRAFHHHKAGGADSPYAIDTATPPWRGLAGQTARSRSIRGKINVSKRQTHVFQHPVSHAPEPFWLPASRHQSSRPLTFLGTSIAKECFLPACVARLALPRGGAHRRAEITHPLGAWLLSLHPVAGNSPFL
jgi:hypothetical protein